MRNGFVCCFVVASAVVGPTRAFAQGDANLEEFRRIASKVIMESKVVPFLRSNDEGQNSPEPTISLLATADGTVAKARFGYLLKDDVSLDGVVTGPLTGESATFATTKGLSAGVTAKASLRVVLNRKDYKVIRNPVQPQTSSFGVFTAPANSSIVAAHHLNQPVFSFDDLVSAALDLAAGIQNSGGRSVAKTAVLSVPLTASLTTPAAAASVAAGLNSDEGRAAFATAVRFYANDLAMWQVERAVILSLSGSSGRPTFTVAQGSKFNRVTKVSKGFDGELGVLKTARSDQLTKGYYLSGGISTGTSFSASAKNICLPIDGASGTLCQNAVTSEPDGKTYEIYRAEARYFFDELRFAVAVRPSYDRLGGDEKWAVEFPIYFLQNSKDLQSALKDDKAGLTGGVTFGWRQVAAGTEFFATFSVGTLFKLPGLPH